MRGPSHSSSITSACTPGWDPPILYARTPIKNTKAQGSLSNPVPIRRASANAGGLTPQGRLNPVGPCLQVQGHLRVGAGQAAHRPLVPHVWLCVWLRRSRQECDGFKKPTVLPVWALLLTVLQTARIRRGDLNEQVCSEVRS